MWRVALAGVPGLAGQARSGQQVPLLPYRGVEVVVQQQLDGLDRRAGQDEAARAAAFTCFLVSRTLSREVSSTTSAIER